MRPAIESSNVDQSNFLFANRHFTQRLLFTLTLLFIIHSVERVSFAGTVDESATSASSLSKRVNSSGHETVGSALHHESSSSFNATLSQPHNHYGQLARKLNTNRDLHRGSINGLRSLRIFEDVPSKEGKLTATSVLVNGAAWEQYAVATNASPDTPWIAIVIDDLGLNHRNAQRAIDIEPPLTLAFMTYAEGLEEMTALARSRGHELMLHVPMEPIDLARNYPGKNALMVDLPHGEIRRRLNWGLSRFEGFVGVNNHMGSRFTQDPQLMALVADTLKRRGLLFLDSMTSGKSVGGHVASKAGIPVAFRDVFLDHEPTPAFVRQQLKQLERVAQRQGYAVAIGHPHAFTLSVLEEWLPHAKARGFSIVPLTSIIRRNQILG